MSPIYADLGAAQTNQLTAGLQRSEHSPLPVSTSPLHRVGDHILTAQRATGIGLPPLLLPSSLSQHRRFL